MSASAERKRAPAALNLVITEAVVALREAVREVQEASWAWLAKTPKSPVQVQNERERYKSAIAQRDRARANLEKLLEEDA